MVSSCNQHQWTVFYSHANLPLMADPTPKFHFSLLLIAGIGMTSLTIVLTFYYCIVVGWCKRRQPPGILQHSQLLPPANQAPGGLDDSFLQLIPVHRITTEEAFTTGDESTCAVCLCEFKEGEEVRQLPECLHLFHVPCIDMWLYSHSSCPLCRKDMTPPPPFRREVPSPDSQ